MLDLEEQLIAAAVQHVSRLSEAARNSPLAWRRDGSFLTIGHYSVRLASLPAQPDAEEARHVLENILTIAMEDWRALTQAAANDLHLLLIGPAGSAESLTWQAIAEEIEGDDRVCRKLVWLPGQPPDPSAFLRRTFLASPWVDAGAGSAGALATLQVDVGIPPRWQSLLHDPLLEGRDLLEKLLTADEETERDR